MYNDGLPVGKRDLSRTDDARARELTQRERRRGGPKIPPFYAVTHVCFYLCPFASLFFFWLPLGVGTVIECSRRLIIFAHFIRHPLFWTIFCIMRACHIIVNCTSFLSPTNIGRPCMSIYREMITEPVPALLAAVILRWIYECRVAVPTSERFSRYCP